jgi:acyl-CoA dehydrogenase
MATDWIWDLLEHVMPKLSRTEREALTAGTVGFEGELFAGKPNWKRFLNGAAPSLSAEEIAFMSGPVEELCHMLDDWQIVQDNDLPPQVWQFLKTNGFFGIIIPKRYGGKEFSAFAHASILMKVGAHNTAAGITISVPNSLGPAELLLKYGTKEQQDHYLPRLASGDEIPCFALTGPHAGSDAAALPDQGTVCMGDFDGKRVLGISLNWDKRYITLAPVATLIGLAFHLRDPEHLVSDEEDLGITCALVPAHLPGITIGERHNPLHVAFQNGPTQGKNVFVPLDSIIGGKAMAGQGWKMLMECLAAGRGITLPSNACALAMTAAKVSGAYARVRYQFGIPIGRFEGIEEALARIGSSTYFNTSVLKLTLAAIDAGEAPAVATAITKYHTTEHARHAINDAMDIHGGKGICMGPKNYLANLYIGMPVSITVEGANILTRSLIIFGQGAIRCHPYIMRELDAVKNKKLGALTKTIGLHILHAAGNGIRAWLHALSGSLIARTPAIPGMRRTFAHLTRFSAAFAFLSDVSLASLGGNLKRKERISARLGDIFSMLYCTSAAVKRYADDQYPKEDRALVDYVVQQALFDMQRAFKETLDNFPNRFLALLTRAMLFPFGYRLKAPSDHLAAQAAELMMNPSGTRSRLMQGITTNRVIEGALNDLENAFAKSIACEELLSRIKQNKKKGVLVSQDAASQAKEAHGKGLLSAEEYERLKVAYAAVEKAIAVDHFPRVTTD